MGALRSSKLGRQRHAQVDPSEIGDILWKKTAFDCLVFKRLSRSGSHKQNGSNGTTINFN